ncbi:MAG: hypothetical protein R2778_06820 [Saprospiraceae bacterium]
MMLNRFQIIIDYSNSSMWFSPSNKFEEKYVFDRSGMTLIAGGKHLNKISVLAIISAPRQMRPISGQETEF